MTLRFVLRLAALLLVGVLGGVAVSVLTGIALGGRSEAIGAVRDGEVAGAIVKARWLHVPGLRFNEDGVTALYKTALREYLDRRPDRPVPARPLVVLCPSLDALRRSSLDPEFELVGHSGLRTRAVESGSGFVRYLSVCVVDATLRSIVIEVSPGIEHADERIIAVNRQRTRFQCRRILGGWTCAVLEADT